MEESKASVNHKDGTITVKIPPITKVTKAWSIYWQYLHEISHEQKGGHPSWAGNGKRLINEIRQIKKTMTQAERDEFAKKISPFVIN